jgi:hypothetical protein
METCPGTKSLVNRPSARLLTLEMWFQENERRTLTTRLKGTQRDFLGVCWTTGFSRRRSIRDGGAHPVSKSRQYIASQELHGTPGLRRREIAKRNVANKITRARRLRLFLNVGSSSFCRTGKCSSDTLQLIKLKREKSSKYLNSGMTGCMSLTLQRSVYRLAILAGYHLASYRCDLLSRMQETTPRSWAAHRA